MKLKVIFILLICGAFIGLTIYYLYPYRPIPDRVRVDKIVVLKSKRRLLAFSKGELIKTYIVALGRNPVGTKMYEGDYKTPEGIYTINEKNANSYFHKSLGISYPDQQDILRAKGLRKPAGGDIKIHGLRKDQGFFGRFQRWRDWTSGCIALTNEEIDDLYKHTAVGTPIEIDE